MIFILQHLLWLLLIFSDVLDSTSVVEDSFEYLDAPIERIAGADVPMPYSPSLEKLSLPQVGLTLYHVFLDFLVVNLVIHFFDISVYEFDHWF